MSLKAIIQIHNGVACAQDLGFIQTFYGRIPVRTLFLFADQSALRTISLFFSTMSKRFSFLLSLNFVNCF